MEELYFVFYTYPAFWIEPYIDPFNDQVKYKNHVRDIRLRFDSSTYSLIIFNDGLIGISDKENSNELVDKDDLSTIFLIWKKYNQLSLLIMAIISEFIYTNKLTAYVEIEEIQAKDYGIVRIEDNKIKRWSFVGLSSFTQMHNKRRLLDFKKPEAGIVYDLALDGKNTIPDETLEYVSNKIDSILSSGKEELYYQLVKSIAEYKKGNYTISFTNSWFIIENLINLMWKKWIIEQNNTFSTGEKRISKDRLKSLLDSNNLTISSVLNVLELVNVLPFDNYKIIDGLRKKRNKITHENEQVTEAEQCTACFDQVNFLFKNNNLPTINLNYSIIVRPIR